MIMGSWDEREPEEEFWGVKKINMNVTYMSTNIYRPNGFSWGCLLRSWGRLVRVGLVRCLGWLSVSLILALLLPHVDEMGPFLLNRPRTTVTVSSPLRLTLHDMKCPKVHIRDAFYKPSNWSS